MLRKEFGVALLFLVLFGCAVSTATIGTGAEPIIITVDGKTTHQTITGWEAHYFAGQPSPAFPNYKDELFDLAINDFGINRLRVEIRSGVENSEDYWTQYQQGKIDHATWRSLRYSTVNDNNDPNNINWAGFHFSEMDSALEDTVLPLKQLAEARGEHLYINLNYVAFTQQIGPGLKYLHDDPNEYAEFVLATFLHLRDEYGFIPDSWEVILEPDNVSQWDGNLIGQAIVAANTRLQNNGFSPRFVAPSTTNMGNAVTYFDDMIKVPGVLPVLEELSYHRYSGVSETNLKAIASRAEQHGINTAMLEHIGSTYQDLHEDIKVGRNSAWSLYVLAVPDNTDPPGGLYGIDTSDLNNPVIHVSERGKFIRQYYKFIRNGAIRVDATSNNSIADPLAFINTDDTYVVVVKTEGGQNLSIAGLPAGTYGIKYTTSSEYDVDLTDITIGDDQALNMSIPAKGVLTVYSRDSSPPPAPTATPIPPEYDEAIFLPFIFEGPGGVTAAGSQERACSKE